MNPLTYLLGFFSGRTGRIHREGAIAPGSKATVEVTLRSPPTPRLELALEAFFSIGALGFRITRAAGALCSVEHALTMEAWHRLTRLLGEYGFVVVLDPRQFPDWVALVRYAGTLLKDRLRSSREGLGISAGQNGRSPNVLGSAVPRQASVVHFRPVRIDGALRLGLIEAPHGRILGDKAASAHGGRGSVLRMAAARDLGPPFS